MSHMGISGTAGGTWQQGTGSNSSMGRATGAPSSSSSGAAAAAAAAAGSAAFPGPHPFSLDSLRDVSLIFTEGLHAAMLAFSDRYGPVCRFANPASLNGASSWVFLNSPENIEHVCATRTANYSRRYLPDIYKFVTHEKGILGSQDEYNARHRKLCAPPFRNKSQLQRFAAVVVERTARLAAIWEQHLEQQQAQKQRQQGQQQQGQQRQRGEQQVAQGEVQGAFLTDVATCTQRLTLDIVGLTAFSHDFQQTEQVHRDLQRARGQGGLGDQASSTDRVLWAVNAFGEVLAEVFITPLPLLKVMDALGFPHLKTLKTAVATMRESMLGVIARRREDLAAGRQQHDDLLSALLQMRDEAGVPMSDEELWEDVHDVMGAGHETTATTTAAVLYCISAHPEVEARVAAELQSVLGDRAPAYLDLPQLQFLSQCIKETLRLYPAIPVFPRLAAAPDVLPSGHAISAGDVVFMSSYSLGRSAGVWDNPLEFKPERFSQQAEAKLHRFAWLPFGAGPRMCLGAGFATMSVTLMTATLLQRFRFQPVRPSSQLIPVAYDITMNYVPTNGLHMEVSPRK